MVLGPILIAAAGASAQSPSTSFGLTGRTLRLAPVLPRYRPFWGSYWYPPGEVRPDDGQRFRTVCVRTCDGYYWPISFSTTRGQFFDDAAQCRSSCKAGARLYYHPNPGGGMEQAVDLEGRAYSELSSAFLYRRKRVEGCACKPAPWSEAERERHSQYRREAEAAGASLPLAGGAEGAGGIDAEPPHVPVGGGGVVVPPMRFERYPWHGRASPYRFSGRPSVAPSMTLRQGW